MMGRSITTQFTSSAIAGCGRGPARAAENCSPIYEELKSCNRGTVLPSTHTIKLNKQQLLWNRSSGSINSYTNQRNHNIRTIDPPTSDLPQSAYLLSAQLRAEAEVEGEGLINGEGIQGKSASLIKNLTNLGRNVGPQARPIILTLWA